MLSVLEEINLPRLQCAPRTRSLVNHRNSRYLWFHWQQTSSQTKPLHLHRLRRVAIKQDHMVTLWEKARMHVKVNLKRFNVRLVQRGCPRSAPGASISQLYHKLFQFWINIIILNMGKPLLHRTINKLRKRLIAEARPGDWARLAWRVHCRIYRQRKWMSFWNLEITTDLKNTNKFMEPIMIHAELHSKALSVAVNLK